MLTGSPLVVRRIIATGEPPEIPAAVRPREDLASGAGDSMNAVPRIIQYQVRIVRLTKGPLKNNFTFWHPIFTPSSAAPQSQILEIVRLFLRFCSIGRNRI